MGQIGLRGQRGPVLLGLLLLPSLACAAGPQVPAPPCRGHPGQAPEMVVIAAGRFLMGSPDTEPERSNAEGPRHGVAVQNPFALGRCEVRVAEFRAFIDDTGYRTDAERPASEGATARGCWGWNVTKNTGEQRADFNWRNPGFAQADDEPVVCVSWNDGRAYAHWLSLRTGQPYRLPTAAEWEYAARAGTDSPFWTGACIHTDQANFDANDDYNGCGAKTGVYRKQTVPAGSLPANPWGLHEVAGNVWEWVADCWHEEPGRADRRRRLGRGGGWGLFPARASRRRPGRRPAGAPVSLRRLEQRG